MEFVAQFSNTIAIVVVGVLIWFYLRGRFERLEQEDRAIRTEIAALRSDLDRKFELLVTEINGVRSDLTRVALAVGARTRPEANPA